MSSKFQSCHLLVATILLFLLLVVTGSEENSTEPSVENDDDYYYDYDNETEYLVTEWVYVGDPTTSTEGPEVIIVGEDTIYEGGPGYVPPEEDAKDEDNEHDNEIQESDVGPVKPVDETKGNDTAEDFSNPDWWGLNAWNEMSVETILVTDFPSDKPLFTFASLATPATKKGMMTTEASTEMMTSEMTQEPSTESTTIELETESTPEASTEEELPVEDGEAQSAPAQEQEEVEKDEEADEDKESTESLDETTEAQTTGAPTKGTSESYSEEMKNPGRYTTPSTEATTEETTEGYSKEITKPGRITSPTREATTESVTSAMTEQPTTELTTIETEMDESTAEPTTEPIEETTESEINKIPDEETTKGAIKSKPVTSTFMETTTESTDEMTSEMTEEPTPESTIEPEVESTPEPTTEAIEDTTETETTEVTEGAIKPKPVTATISETTTEASTKSAEEELTTETLEDTTETEIAETSEMPVEETTEGPIKSKPVTSTISETTTKSTEASTNEGEIGGDMEDEPTTATIPTEPPTTEAVDKCSLAPDIGTGCRRWRMYYWDPPSGQCKPMQYRGPPGGNANRFNSLYECIKTCGNSVEFEEKLQEDDVTIAKPTPADCSLPVDEGHCTGSFVMFHFDGVRCTNFRYSGCGGNANRFFTYAHCKATCYDGRENAHGWYARKGKQKSKAEKRPWIYEPDAVRDVADIVGKEQFPLVPLSRAGKGSVAELMRPECEREFAHYAYHD